MIRVLRCQMLFKCDPPKTGVCLCVYICTSSVDEIDPELALQISCLVLLSNILIIHVPCLIFVPKSRNGFVKNREPSNQHVTSSTGRQNSVIQKLIGICGWFPCHQNISQNSCFSLQMSCYYFYGYSAIKNYQKFPYKSVFFFREWSIAR